MFENFRFSIYVKYFFALLSFLLVPFLSLVIFLGNYVMTQYKNEIYDLAQNSVEYISTMVEDELADVVKVQALLQQENAIKNFITQPAGNIRGDKVYKAYEASKVIEEYYMYREIIDEIHLYSKLQDVVVVPSGIYTKEAYFKNYVAQDGLEFEDWCKIIKDEDTTATSIVYNVPQKGYVPALLNVLRYGNEKEGVIFAVINVRRIIEIYTEITEGMPKMYFALTSKEHILAESGEKPEGISFKMMQESENRVSIGRGYIIFKSELPSSELCYQCIVSENFILEKFVEVEKILGCFIIILIFGIVVLAYLFSHKTFVPVKKMMLVSIDQSGNVCSLKDLQDMFLNVFNSNKNLRELVRNQEECINSNIFRMFVQNSKGIDANFQKILFRGTSVNIEGKLFRAAFLRLWELDESAQERINYKMLTKLQYECEENSVSYRVIPSEEKNRLILFIYEKHGTDIETVLEQVRASLTEENIPITMALGREVNDLKDFSKSYDDAVFSVIRCNNRGVKFNDEENLSDKFCFIDREKLFTCILTGNLEQLTREFEVFHSLMFEEYLMTHRAHNCFNNILLRTIEELSSSNGSDSFKLIRLVEKCKNALELTDYEESFQIFRLCFIEAINVMIDIKRGKKSSFEDAIQYINENYAQYDISLKSVAENVDISYKYLSDVFKKETGKNFLGYLHALRDKHAKELLLTTDYSIVQIGEMVGYLSDNTFVKTFKKLNGITPGEFRNSVK